MIVIYAGSGSKFVASIWSWENPLGLLIPVAFSIYMIYTRKITFSLAFNFLIIGFLLYFIAVTLKFHAFHPRFLGVYLIYFVITYIIIYVFKQRFFYMFLNIVYYLSIISLFFWLVQVLMQDTLIQILSPLSISGPDRDHINIIVYTIEQPGILVNFPIPRNSGFAWEPGVFATYINLAVFSLLIANKFDVLGNKKFWVLVITLITTMSTTGYSILLVLLVFYAYNQKSKYFVALVPVIIVLSFYMSTLPFMTEKIQEVSNYNIEERIYSSVTWGIDYRPQRFESFQIDLIDFLNNPIIGYGGHTEERWILKLGAKIHTVSGIGNLLAIFGMVGAVFFFFHLTSTSKDFAKTFGYSGWFFQLIIILMISISYALILTPLLMSFWLMRSNFLPSIELLKYRIYSQLITTYG